MLANYDSSFDFVLKREGGKVDNQTDHGGRTNMGITQRTYDAYRRKHGLPTDDVFNMTQGEAKLIYQEFYWDAAHCTIMPTGTDLLVFDSAVQHGNTEAIKLAQRALGVIDDGVLGQHTIDALQKADQKHLADAYLIQRHKLYLDIVKHDPSQAQFLHGWLNRLDLVAEAIGAGVVA